MTTIYSNLSDAQKESRRQYARNWNETHKAQRNEYNRAATAAKKSQYYRNKEKYTASNLDSHYRRAYNLTTKQVDQMIADRNGLCDICGLPEKIEKRLSVDHSHKTGQVRGMLCTNCNVGIARFNDSPELMRVAALYMEQTT